MKRQHTWKDLYEQIGHKIKNWMYEEIEKTNYWGELASIICCDRSDIFFRTLMRRIKTFREVESKKNSVKTKAVSKGRKTLARNSTHRLSVQRS